MRAGRDVVQEQDGPGEQVCSQGQHTVLARVCGWLQRSFAEARAVWGASGGPARSRDGRHGHTPGAWVGGQLAPGGGRIAQDITGIGRPG
ncbi:hypothetical protein ACFU90_14330 [Streptomyces noursei]|uniref:hypothetical protein n=1 Tax=Streptomyces noursei TaxID=1971 RepID=UPI0005CA4725|nr:hypothetical protein [Streptomyces noursei]